MAKQELEAAIADIGLSIAVEFVPFSRSRNAKEKYPSLNWKVTLKRGDRDVLTTDYMSGCAHCPSYNLSIKSLGGRYSIMRDAAFRFECENGYAARVMPAINYIAKTGKPLVPEICDVLYSLASDGDVIDYDSFEHWAQDFGYDVDSRAAEKTYQACLSIALKLRAGLGDANMTKLREACQDY